MEMINANDTILILNFSKKSFTTVLRDLERFGAISSLPLLNNKKTEILWIGARARRQDKFMSRKRFKILA